MAAATLHLRALARQVAQGYGARTAPRAILVVGSAATGTADVYSDLDMLVYHDRVPAPDAIAQAPRQLGADDYRGTPWSDDSGKPDASGVSERFSLGGIECQVGHVSVGAAEREIARVVDDLELSEELLKIMSGLFEGLPLSGAALIQSWRRRATPTEDLKRAMIQKRWRFFPWWHFQERLRTRDATVWRYDVLVQSAYGIVGVLAALNGLYFSTFEFKRAETFLSRLETAPTNLPARLASLFDADERESTDELERLVADTQAVVSARFPDLDLPLEWAGRPTPPGSRETPWRLVD